MPWVRFILKINTIVFFNSDFFGTGSNPWEPQGWHFEILLTDKIDPLNNPCSFNALIEYSEQVGKYRQFCPSIGEINNWYNLIIMIKGNEMIIKGISSRGRLTTDTYTLTGFTTAHNKLKKDC